MKKVTLLLLFLLISYAQYGQKVKYIREDGEEFMSTIYALIGDKKQKLPVPNDDDYACPLIEDQGDYNFDGYTDVLIAWTSCRGSCCANTFQIYFFDGKYFHRSKIVGYDWEGVEIVRNKKGLYRFVIATTGEGYGNTNICNSKVEVFGVKGYEFVKLKEIKGHFIKVKTEIRSAQFAEKGVDEEKPQSLAYDLDNDGKMDSIVCNYWWRWGRMHWKILFGNGKKFSGETIGAVKRIGVLETKTKGICDLVLDF
ncbi:MAG: hypothetical protein KGV44_10870 [Flavobacteriaceae bacterium]|nr:hypothetical protein [Flavobacteriaceae bacterium]